MNKKRKGNRGLFIIGLVFVTGGCYLSFYGETEAYKNVDGIEDALESVKTISVDVPDSSNDGYLVHLVGSVTSEGNLSDDEFRVLSKSIVLRRKMEMYQHYRRVTSTTSTERDMGSRNSSREVTRTSSTYFKKWSDKLEPSQHFNNKEDLINPSAFPVNPFVTINKNVKIGVYRLDPGLLERMSDFKALVLTQEQFNQAKLKLDNQFEVVQKGYNYIFLSNDLSSSQELTPKIGDTRLYFEVIPDEKYSIVGEQKDNMIGLCTTETGLILGNVQNGDITAEEVLLVNYGATIEKWGSRFGSSFLLIFGAFLFAIGNRRVIPGYNRRSFGWVVFVFAFAVSAQTVATGVARLPFSLSTGFQIIGLGILMFTLVTNLTIRFAKNKSV